MKHHSCHIAGNVVPLGLVLTHVAVSLSCLILLCVEKRLRETTSLRVVITVMIAIHARIVNDATRAETILSVARFTIFGIVGCVMFLAQYYDTSLTQLMYICSSSALGSLCVNRI